ncbi:hypothetical protein RB595_000606 [Gaeumannomyces hyphopodioides]
MNGLRSVASLSRQSNSVLLRQSSYRGLSRLSPAASTFPALAQHKPWSAAALASGPVVGSRAGLRRPFASESDSKELGKTPLYDLHLARGAKMVPFGGFHMPVQYSGQSVSASHHFTREKASLFDVSHMVQRRFSGKGAAAFLELVTPSGIADLGVHHSTLTTLLHRRTGGIVDDCIVTRLDDQLFYVVTNAACRDKDDAYFERELADWAESHGAHSAVDQEILADRGLVALQGPLSAEILTEILAEPAEVDVPSLHFGTSRYGRVRLLGMEVSSPLLISRGGYTGEDGFEISIPDDETTPVVEALLAAAGPDRLALAGLGARDSLRLEAGMCLYGHDLDDSTTPVEAGLAWIIPKARRQAGAGFHGAEVVVPSLTLKSKGGAGVERRRVGLVVEGAPAREGAEIVGGDAAEKLGVVTSGCPSPTLGKNIAMGYIKDGFHKVGTEVAVLVRGKPRKAVVTKMPFVPTKYWKGAAPA